MNRKIYRDLVIMQHLIDRGVCFVVIDPHGSLAHKVKRSCARLPKRDQQKTMVIQPAVPKMFYPLNPFHLRRDGEDEIT